MSVGPHLDTLEAAGLIRLAAVRPELLYLFRHWLIQDAAYTSLLKQERRELHRIVGETLERLYPETEPEHAAELALHFERAEVWDRAVHYLIEAGHYALERYANKEAVSFFDRAASLIPAGDDSPERLQQRVEIELGRVRAGFTLQRFDEQIATLQRILPDAEKQANQRLLRDVLLWMALIRQARGERPEASPELRRALDRAAEIGESLGDPSANALPLAIMGMSQVRTGELRAGIATLEKVVPFLEQRRVFIGGSMALDTLALGYARLGEFERAREAARRAVALAEGGDPIARLDAQIVEANIESMLGNLGQAEELAQQCVRQADALGSPQCMVFGRFVLGDVQLRQGQPQQAKPTLEQGDVLAFGAAYVRPWITGWLAAAQAELGDLAGARPLWESAIASAKQFGDRFSEGAIRLRRAATLARRPDPQWQEVLADLEVSIAAFEAAEARPFLADALALRAMALAAVGRPEEARGQLDRAAGVLESMGFQEKAERLRAGAAGQPAR